MDKVLISHEKLAELKKELKELVEVKRPEVIKHIQEARAQGDLSENADYDAAKDTQGEIEGKINEINSILNNYELINDNNEGKLISIGSKVSIDDGKDTDVYEIVGTIEANPFENKISNHSPLATSLLGHKEGETVVVQGVETPYKVKIVKVSN
jgi:transcription elongation factor GreA